MIHNTYDSRKAQFSDEPPADLAWSELDPLPISDTLSLPNDLALVTVDRAVVENTLVALSDRFLILLSNLGTIGSPISKSIPRSLLSEFFVPGLQGTITLVHTSHEMGKADTTAKSCVRYTTPVNFDCGLELLRFFFCPQQADKVLLRWFSCLPRWLLG